MGNSVLPWKPSIRTGELSAFTAVRVAEGIQFRVSVCVLAALVYLLLTVSRAADWSTTVHVVVSALRTRCLEQSTT